MLVKKMQLSGRILGRFLKSVDRRMISEGGEYFDQFEYELSLNCLGMKMLIGIYYEPHFQSFFIMYGHLFFITNH